MKKSRKGFTLAELLIAVAIIAVLVAVAIPIFGSQLEKSREAAAVSYTHLMTDQYSMKKFKEIFIPRAWEVY